MLTAGKKRLQHRFPSSIDEWDTVNFSSHYILYSPSDLICMANLARKMKLEELHIRILYHCVQLDTKILLDGCPGADGRTEHLNTPDLVSCIDARCTLHSAMAELRQGSTWEVDPKYACCRKVIMQDVDTMRQDWLVDHLEGYNPLGSPDFVEECTTTSEWSACHECTSSCQGMYTRRRQDILDTLASFFPRLASY